MIERSIRLKEEDYEILVDIAESENVTVSALMRMAIQRLIREFNDCVDLVDYMNND